MPYKLTTVEEKFLWLAHLDILANRDGHPIPEARDMHRLGHWCNIDEDYLERRVIAWTWTSEIPNPQDPMLCAVPIDERFEKYADDVVEIEGVEHTFYIEDCCSELPPEYDSEGLGIP